MKAVGLVRWRGEPMLEHDGHQLVDPPRRFLLAEVKGLVPPEGLAQDEDGVRVGRFHRLKYHNKRAVKRDYKLDSKSLIWCDFSGRVKLHLVCFFFLFDLFWICLSQNVSTNMK